MLADRSLVGQTYSKPPSKRRLSAQREGLKSHSRTSSPLQASPIPDQDAFYTHDRIVERDLDLDLPLDLTSALEKSVRRKPSSTEQTSYNPPDDTTEEQSELNRLQHKTRRTVLGDLQQPSEPQSLVNHVMHDDDDGEKASSVHSTDSLVSYGSTERYVDMDRDQLEKLLIQANQVIKERERDLGIAAAVGQALLDKNLSLREKYSSVSSRFPSLNSLERLIADQTPTATTPLPRYSPPHKEKEDHSSIVTSQGSAFNLRTSGSEGYFAGISPSSSIERIKRIRELSTSPRKANQHAWETANETPWKKGVVPWSPKKDHFVPSQPPSPYGERSQDDSSNFNVAFASSKTHRQLDLIAQENDELLEQLAQLQLENEEAKRDGGKRLKKLRREIDGLRTELEATQARNSLLEQGASTYTEAPSGKENEQYPKRKVWRRRGTFPLKKDTWCPNPNDGPSCADTLVPKIESSPTPEDALHPFTEQPGLTGSNKSDTFEPRLRDAMDGEQALVSQLMAKVQELEEMNALLAHQANERDGRIGQFMQDSERIRDAYEAAECEAVNDMEVADGAHLSEQSHPHTPISSSKNTPTSQSRRRAVGNRYLIEGRKTLLAAMSDDWSPSHEDNKGYANSRSQSPVPSLRRQRSRPRIRITPSFDDLRARKADEEAGWEDLHPTLPTSDGNAVQGSPKDYTPFRIIRKRASEADLSATSQFNSMSSICAAPTLCDEIKEEDSQAGEGLYSSDARRRLIVQAGHRVIRKAESSVSLRSQAESDIADIKWAQDASDPHPPLGDNAHALITLGNKTELQRTIDGEWYEGLESRVVPPNSLNNNTETSHETYDLLEELAANTPVHWADDDDFGRPITERDARRLGLLEAASVRKASRGMLGWILSPSRSAKAKRKEGSASTAKQIESSESIARHQELQRMLRDKRAVALQNRVLSGQLSAEQANQRGAFDQHYLETEATQRAFAHRSALSRRNNRKASEQHQDDKQEQVTPEYSRRYPKEKAQKTLRQRYDPVLVRQRVHKFSNETLTWISAWAAFSVVMIFAFVATFARGPKRVLHGQRE